jgi:hypothetical protein
MEVRISGGFLATNKKSEIGIYIKTATGTYLDDLYGKWCGGLLHISGGDVEHNYNILKEIKRR